MTTILSQPQQDELATHAKQNEYAAMLMWEQIRPLVWSYAKRHYRKGHAMDAMQEGFEAYWLAIPKFDTAKGHANNFFLTAVRRRIKWRAKQMARRSGYIIDGWSKRQGVESRDIVSWDALDPRDRDGLGGVTVDETPMPFAREAAIYALSCLDWRDKKLVILRNRGLTYAAIACRLGLSTERVRQRWNNAKAAMRKKLEGSSHE